MTNAALFWLSACLPFSLLDGLVLEHGTHVESDLHENRMAFANLPSSGKLCPGQVGLLGVHAAAAQCTADFQRIEIREVPMPHVGLADILVDLEWSSVNPCDWKNFMTRGNYVPGIDFAGTVKEVGQACGFSPGDRVWGLTTGAYADYLLTSCNAVARVPQGMSLQQAGILGVTGTTAYESFKLGYGVGPWSSAPKVLVIGGSSGTGHIGIQLAKAWGASKVITTARAENKDFVTRMGADEVIDYRTTNWWDVLKRGSVDLIYDCVCLAGTGDHAYDVLSDFGSFITLNTWTNEPSPHAIESRPSIRHVAHNGLIPSFEGLNELSRLVVEGRLNSTVDTVFDLEEVAEAFEYSTQGHTVGKIAIRL